MSLARLSSISVARLQDNNHIQEVCTVDVIGQIETKQYECTACMEPGVQCVQCVRVDCEGRDWSA